MNVRQVGKVEALEHHARLWNMQFPQYPKNTAELAFWYDTHPENAFFASWLLEADDRVVGLINMMDMEDKHPPQHLVAELNFDPAFEEDATTTAMEVCETAAYETGVERLEFWTSDQFTIRNELIAAKGYDITQRAPVSRLMLDEFEAAPFEAKIASVRSQGFRFATASDLDREGWDWELGLFESIKEINADVPRTFVMAEIPLETHREIMRKRDHDLMFFALDGQHIVGYSRVAITEMTPELAETGISGALRAYRRRGIVTALKVMGIEALKGRGVKSLLTDNDEKNPMYQLNLQLGFKPAWTWLSYERRIK